MTDTDNDDFETNLKDFPISDDDTTINEFMSKNIGLYLKTDKTDLEKKLFILLDLCYAYKNNNNGLLKEKIKEAGDNIYKIRNIKSILIVKLNRLSSVIFSIEDFLDNVIIKNKSYLNIIWKILIEEVKKHQYIYDLYILNISDESEAYIKKYETNHRLKIKYCILTDYIDYLLHNFKPTLEDIEEK